MFLIILFSLVVEFLKIKILSFNSIFFPSLGPINARGCDETDPQNLSNLKPPSILKYQYLNNHKPTLSLLKYLIDRLHLDRMCGKVPQ